VVHFWVSGGSFLGFRWCQFWGVELSKNNYLRITIRLTPCSGCIRQNMRHRIVSVNSQREQVQLFVRFANKYKSDFHTHALQEFFNYDIKTIWRFVQSKYLLETEEQIIRPLFYAQVGGDCDDGFIFVVSFLLAGGISPDKIFVVEVKENYQDDFYCHIFPVVQDTRGRMIWLDNLPQSRFNKLDYSENLINITPVSEYLK